MIDKQFYFVYILRSLKHQWFYSGHTDNIPLRKMQHDIGQVQASSPHRPLELIFFEGYENKYDAIRREKYFKTSKGKTTLRWMLREYFHNHPLE
ncbi:MAG: GIY-YIG nuclease family protein [Candidatus Kerfeldbacteria bacterium]|nr:GIY-YIG nuclease family protein [Candidatus Kerfeldbacteria bacterium]